MIDGHVTTDSIPVPQEQEQQLLLLDVMHPPQHSAIQF